jgi:ferritin-like metal-binding protein YciE
MPERFEEETMAGSLRDLYVDELRDIYHAESQLVRALPKMAKHAHSDELRNAFQEHREQSKEHMERLEQVFDSLDAKPKGKKCQGMEGLIEETSDLMKEDLDSPVLDAALISAAQRVEHYEIAAYGTVCAFAELLGESEQAQLLRETLREEKETDRKLTELSRDINRDAAEVEAERERPKLRRAA